MNIFSEIYGSYFRAVEKLLSMDKITKSDVYNAARDEAFAESFFFIESKIIPNKKGDSDWGLLKRREDGTFAPKTKGKPAKLLTTLQRRWLKTILADPRFGLFLDDCDIAALDSRLGDVKPLYDSDFFYRFDIYTNGDNFTGVSYRRHFKMILSAVKSGESLKIEYISSHGNRVTYGEYLPLKIEYSRKDDKFRLYCRRIYRNCTGKLTTINIGRITKVKKTGKYPEKIPESDSDIFDGLKCKKPIELEITSERNGIERFMMEFSCYEKHTELDIDTGICRVLLYYDENAETEVLIRLLSYGAVLKIISPEGIRKQVEDRVRRQYFLIKGG